MEEAAPGLNGRAHFSRASQKPGTQTYNSDVIEAPSGDQKPAEGLENISRSSRMSDGSF